MWYCDRCRDWHGTDCPLDAFYFWLPLIFGVVGVVALLWMGLL